MRRARRGASDPGRVLAARQTWRRRLGVALAAVVLASGTAAAQGRGNGAGNGRPQQPRPSAQGAAPARGGGQSAAAPGTGLRPLSFYPQFGSWLGDASTPTAGGGYVSVGVSYWRGAGASQVDAPVLGMTYGVTNRAQLSATVPFYRASYQGITGSGLDNVYISGKVAVVDPDAGAGRVGLAVGAVAEILSAGVIDGSRVHWAVPLSLELRASPVRVYGSTGYFSRGAFFAAGALEFTTPGGTSLTGALAHSMSVPGITVTSTVATPRPNLLDASVWVSHPVSSIASVYVAAGRTFSNTSVDGAGTVSGGVSFPFSATGASNPSRR